MTYGPVADRLYENQGDGTPRMWGVLPRALHHEKDWNGGRGD